MGVSRRCAALGAALLLPLTLAGCEYVRLLRPNVLAQLDPEMVALVNELPVVDEPNEALIGRVYATGGLSRAQLGEDGLERDRLRVPRNVVRGNPTIIYTQLGR